MKKNDRVFKVYEMICEGKYSFEEIRKEVDVSIRTLRYYIKQMPDGYETKPGGEQKAPIYYYPGPNPPPFRIGSRNLQEPHIRALRLAVTAFQRVEKIPEAARIEEAVNIALENAISLEEDNPAYQKKLKTLKEETDFSDVVYFAQTSMRDPVGEEIWGPLLTACKEQKMVRIKYISGWKNTEKSALVYPLLVAKLIDDWYLLAAVAEKPFTFCGDDRSRHQAPPTYRQYNLSRFTYVSIEKANFRPPKVFDRDVWMNRTFGAFIGDPHETEEIKLEFDKRVAPLLEKRHFHPSQKTKREDNKLILTFPVTTSAAGPEWKFYHLRKWILSWGYDCKVLGPPDLLELIKMDIDKIRGQYCVEITT